MKVTLNKEQLHHISKYIKARGVSYTDVNAEMTDHIASEVEALILTEEDNFLEVVKKVFLKYDRFHFMRIEEEQQNKLEKQSWKSFKNGFLGFFSFPKIVFTLCLFFALYKLVALGAMVYIGYFYCLFVCILGVFLYYFKRKILGKGTYLQLAKFHWIFSILINLGIQMMFRVQDFTVMTNPLVASSFSTLMYLFAFIGIELYRNEFRKMSIHYV
tara:strand:+ start:679 stop:1323 length:645 start_codon:yes stop_codon:yes gene_type:complete